MTNPIPPYGVAIQDSIASGDVGHMQKVAAAAESYLQEYGEIGDGLKKLHAEIGRLSGTGGAVFQPLYGVAIREAMQSGDPGKMQTIAKQAEDWLNQADEVRSALADLRKAMSG